MGWERTLIKQVFKKEYDRLPSEVGVVVNNAQTVIELGKTLSTGKTVSTRLVTVSGNGIKNPIKNLFFIKTPIFYSVTLIITKLVPSIPIFVSFDMFDNSLIVPSEISIFIPDTGDLAIQVLFDPLK